MQASSPYFGHSSIDGFAAILDRRDMVFCSNRLHLSALQGGDHAPPIAVGIIAVLLLPVPFTATLIFATKTYPM